jgi:predicted Zn-dependent protease
MPLCRLIAENMLNSLRYSLSLLLGLLLTLPLSAHAQDNIMLPDLGDSASGVASLEQEYMLGRAWLRLYRNQVPELNDPLMQSYIEALYR